MDINEAKLTEEEMWGALHPISLGDCIQEEAVRSVADVATAKALQVAGNAMREVWRDLYGEGFECDNPAMERILEFAKRLDAGIIRPEEVVHDSY